MSDNPTFALLMLILILTTLPRTLSRNTPDNQSCTCTFYWLCKEADNPDIDIRIGSSTNVNPCKNKYEICCDPIDDLTTPSPPTPTSTPRPPNPSPTPTPRPPNPSPRPTPEGCGYPNPQGLPFNSQSTPNRTQSLYGQFPWMVAILNQDGVYTCGGSLIHPQVVVTAAHCVALNRTLKTYPKIRAGDWDRQHTNEPYPHQDRDVASIVVHPQFYKKSLFNDLALLFLTRPVDLAPNVGLICLPPKGLEYKDDGTSCVANGWGKDSFDEEDEQHTILKKIELPIVARDVCEVMLRKTRLGKKFMLHPSFLCAGGKGKSVDTCEGDGGGPFACPVSKGGQRYHLSGVVSWGIGCGHRNSPGAYSNVALFRTWIDREVQRRNFNTFVYQY